VTTWPKEMFIQKVEAPHAPSVRRSARLPDAGRPVLISWQGTGPGGLCRGTDYRRDGHLQQIAAVSAGHGHLAGGRLLFDAGFPAGVHTGRGNRTRWFPLDG
jgi:hypothetical protein